MLRRFAIVALLLGTWPYHAGLAAEDYFFCHDNVMGTSMELSVRADDIAAARRAEDRTLREIDRLAAIFSNHDPASEFRRWQAAPAGPAKVSPELFELLSASDAWRDRSGGAFDPRVQALSRLWSDAARRNRLPTRAELDAATTTTARPAWRLDASAGTAERLSDAPLTLDAIAKGYIVERACAAALSGDPAVRGLVLNVGGDLRVQGDPARTIAVAAPHLGSETTEPLAWVEVKDRAVATSGQKHRGYRVEGRWYSHILDPRTGEPVSGVLSATVIAERSADADALDTILNVLPPAEGLRLADSLPGVACLIVDADGRLYRNAAWQLYERPAPAAVARLGAPEPAAARAEAEGGWGDDHELLIRFEINRPQEKGRYRRPYVAVWVEDEGGAPVRNLLLWVSMGGPGPFEWLPDLKRWYADDRARTKANKTDVFQIAQPTRPPGEYSALWDGKDDHGKPLKAGTYTVLIEAVREQGGYGLIRRQVTLAGEAFVKELKGNDEIKSATLEYRLRRAAR
jgi:thiamine biosynthesis lipoprotein